MIRIRSDRELAEWIEAGRGVIYNDFSPSLGTPRENRLHRASCRHLQRANVQVDKYASLDEADATAWLEQRRGPEDIAWFRCGSCFASSPTWTQSEIGAAQRSGSNDWVVARDALTVTARLPRTIGYRADLLKGVKFESWNFSLPEDDFVMESVSFRALPQFARDPRNRMRFETPSGRVR